MIPVSVAMLWASEVNGHVATKRATSALWRTLAALNGHVGASVAVQQLGAVVFEGAAVHGVHGGHDSDGGPVVPYAFESLKAGVVLVETSLDALDSCSQGDRLLAVLARCFDQGVEHR
ncbi:hypothetical protein ABZY05_08605 [Streptomyces canus]|uniref:hypothetical protein n=1 Tax=Streptomyces canus TaxID=58343 RepID=UPI0033BC7DBF